MMMMRRLRLFAASVGLVAALTGCWPQGWHWARTPASGSSTTQTLVYWQNDVVGYQGPYVAEGARIYDSHPELTVRMVDTCPAGRHCIRWVTEDLAYPNVAITSVATGSGTHLAVATVRLDPDVGRNMSVEFSKGVIFHEACHGYGGGFGDGPIHEGCNHKSLVWSEISRVYDHNHPG
jgi:hypothetical protein